MPSSTAAQSSSPAVPPDLGAAERRRRAEAHRSPLRDTIVLAGILALTNYLLSPADPCWLGANPTPLLLLPILIGGRYGVAAGLLIGVFTTGSVLAIMQLLGTPAAELLATHALALAAFPTTGLLCGEIRSYFATKMASLIERCDQLEVEHGRARANLELYADSNTALQRRLAVYGVRLTSLDSELRRLLAPSGNDLFNDALALLNRVTEITEAAIYTVDGRDLKRRALLGNGDELPEDLRADHVEIIDQAIAEKQMTTCRELWGDTPQLFSRHLAAVPWLDPAGSVAAILLVRRMPFHCATWEGFAQIETICNWISQYAHLRQATGALAGEDAYERTVTLCINTHQRHALPSSAVHFVARGTSPITQKKLEDAISQLLCPTDLATRFDLEAPNLAVLLPMEGRREAERLVELVSSDLSIEFDTRMTQTEDLDSTESFMRRLKSGS